MDDSRLPKQLFRGEMCEGRKKESKPKKRFKDSVKMCISANQWHELIHVDIESFEKSRVQYAAYKERTRTSNRSTKSPRQL